MIERFLPGCLVWLGQLVCLVLPAAAIALFVLALTKKRRAAAAALALCLLLELGAAAWIVRHPFFRCPEEYRPYVTAEITAKEQEEIIRFNSGLWSAKIPVFPVCVDVQYADGERIHVKTRYFFFGSTEMELNLPGSTDPGPSLIRGLS